MLIGATHDIFLIGIYEFITLNSELIIKAISIFRESKTDNFYLDTSTDDVALVEIITDKTYRIYLNANKHSGHLGVYDRDVFNLIVGLFRDQKINSVFN